MIVSHPRKTSRVLLSIFIVSLKGCCDAALFLSFHPEFYYALPALFMFLLGHHFAQIQSLYPSSFLPSRSIVFVEHIKSILFAHNRPLTMRSLFFFSNLSQKDIALFSLLLSWLSSFTGRQCAFFPYSVSFVNQFDSWPLTFWPLKLDIHIWATKVCNWGLLSQQNAWYWHPYYTSHRTDHQNSITSFFTICYVNRGTVTSSDGLSVRFAVELQRHRICSPVLSVPHSSLYGINAFKDAVIVISNRYFAISYGFLGFQDSLHQPFYF